ncbi:MAG: DUF3857 domain-containing protein [Candidatus Methylacidiphilales bacterium]
MVEVRFSILFILFLIWIAPSGWAASEALIITGVTGGETESEEFAQWVSKTERALTLRGLPKDQIRRIGGQTGKEATRESILNSIQTASSRLGEEDEFWLILFGHSSRGRNNVPTFQVKGVRVSADDLQQALEPIKARQFVFIGTGRSGAYLPYLKHPNRDVLAATSEEGEVHAPRFPHFWVESFLKNPQAGLNHLAAEAAQSLKHYLELASLAQGEHARLYDSAKGEILSAPFGVEGGEDLAVAQRRERGGASSPVSPEEIIIPSEFKQDLFVFYEATEESRQIIGDAGVAPNPDRYGAMVMRRDIELTVNGDRSTRETVRSRVYLVDESMMDRWANYRFPLNPPVEVTKVEGARIILPNGEFYALNTEIFEKTASGTCSLYFPQAVTGSVVEIHYHISRKPDFSIPEFYLEYPLQESIPVLNASFTLKVPKQEAFYHFLKNIEAEAKKSETEHSQEFTWKFEQMPAYESLPHDPPYREVSAWLGVSSLESWEKFTDWYLRITEGAFTAGPQVKAKAAEIKKNYKTRMERIRAAYEFVNALRYVAIEFGIAGLRPRTPEQVISNRYGDCKDKANLLIALLKEMGIEAHFVLINRMSSTDPEFPGWQFNHAIAYVPEGEGQPQGMWLDSTDTVTPFGFVAPGNVGRQGLVFEGRKSRFMEVTAYGDAVTTVKQHWQLSQQASGEWQGNLQVVWTGMAGYHSRQHYDGLSPRQLEYQASQLVINDYLIREWKALEVSNPRDFSSPLTLKAQIVSEENRFPGFASGWTGYYSAPQRNRDMLLNDNQKLRLEQTVSMSFASKQTPRKLAGNYDKQFPGHRWSIRYNKKDAQTWERIAIYEMDQPRVAPNHYPEVRRELNAWVRRLQQDTF